MIVTCLEIALGEDKLLEHLERIILRHLTWNFNALTHSVVLIVCTVLEQILMIVLLVIVHMKGFTSFNVPYCHHVEACLLVVLVLYIFHHDVVLRSVGHVEKVSERNHQRHVVILINIDGVVMSLNSQVCVFVLFQCPLVAKAWEIFAELVIVHLDTANLLLLSLDELTSFEPIHLLICNVEDVIGEVSLQSLEPVIQGRERVFAVLQDSHCQLPVVLSCHPAHLIKVRARRAVAFIRIDV